MDNRTAAHFQKCGASVYLDENAATAAVTAADFGGTMFFITWTGKGYVSFLILIGALFPAAALYVYGTTMLPEDIFGEVDPFDDNLWYLFSFYMLIVSLATLPLGRIFLKEPLREVVNDRKTGTRHVTVTEHTVLDVNVRYHAWIFFGVGAVCLIFGLLETAGILKTGIEQYL